MSRRTQPPRPPAAPPASAAEGAAHVRAFMVKLYDRQDGQGVDWKLVAETLFRAAFDVMDTLPEDACRMVARRVHEGSYGRMTEGPNANSVASKTGPDQVVSELANIAGIKSPKPDPGKLH